MSPQDRISVPSLQHRAWLSNTGLSSQKQGEEKV